jgi:hypothetical protein
MPSSSISGTCPRSSRRESVSPPARRSTC